MNIEINCTYVNLGLLLLFCVTGAQFMAILYGLAARCLFGVVFLHKAKQGRWLCAVSTPKSLPHQRTAHWFTVKSLRHGQSLISSPSHGSVVMRFLRETFLKVFASRKLEEHVLSGNTTMDSGEPGRQYCSPTWETHIPSDSCSPTWETHIPSELCCSKWETHIPSDMCSPTRETHIPSDMCSPTAETHFHFLLVLEGEKKTLKEEREVHSTATKVGRLQLKFMDGKLFSIP